MSNFASGYIKYINNLEQINDAAVYNPSKMIDEVEDAYREHLENIARNITLKHKSVKVCMLAGPSASGKTTSAHLLQKYLKNFGVTSHIISLDDYYLDRKHCPKNPDGTDDYETVNSLDVKRIKETLKAVCNSETIHVPHFDFENCAPMEEDTEIALSENDIVIMEGLHALNPVFTNELKPEKVVKLYVSVKQSIEDINGEVISAYDLRLTRRIVRDMQFRATEAEKTLSMWNSVLDGEEKYIRPYKLSADYSVNSIHIYEPCVLRTLAISVLRKIPEDSPVYRKARELDSKLMRFEPVDAVLVPRKSMLREFIGAKYKVQS